MKYNELKLFRAFWLADNEMKKEIFYNLNDDGKYALFELQEIFRQIVFEGHKDLSAQYDLIDKTNASKYLKVDDDHIVINWPDNLGFKKDSINIIDKLKEKKYIVSRVQYDGESNDAYLKLFKLKVDRNFNNRDRVNCIAFYNNEKLISILKSDKKPNIKYNTIHKIIKKIYYNNSALSIPKLQKKSFCDVGILDLDEYKLLIDYILFKRLHTKCVLSNHYYIDRIDDFKLLECYDDWKKELKALDKDIFKETNYGYYGTVNKFGDLEGGGLQMNLSFSYEMLSNLNIITKLFRFNGNKEKKYFNSKRLRL